MSASEWCCYNCERNESHTRTCRMGTSGAHCCRTDVRKFTERRPWNKPWCQSHHFILATKLSSWIRWMWRAAASLLLIKYEASESQSVQLFALLFEFVAVKDAQPRTRVHNHFKYASHLFGVVMKKLSQTEKQSIKLPQTRNAHRCKAICALQHSVATTRQICYRSSA